MLWCHVGGPKLGLSGHLTLTTKGIRAYKLESISVTKIKLFFQVIMIWIFVALNTNRLKVPCIPLARISSHVLFQPLSRTCVDLCVDLSHLLHFKKFLELIITKKFKLDLPQNEFLHIWKDFENIILKIQNKCNLNASCDLSHHRCKVYNDATGFV